MPRHSRQAWACLVSACVSSTWAQERLTPPDKAPKPPITVEADDVRARPDLDVTAEGNAVLQQGELEIKADHMSYEQLTDIAKARGNVQLSTKGNKVSGPEMQLQVQRFEGWFVEPTYFFSRTDAGGSARRIDFLGEDVAVATGATYTSCPRDGTGDPAWLLSTDSVRLDFANNEGIAHGGVLRFYGVPILAAPTLSFPLTDARKSGWLPPTLGLDSKSGLQLSVPYYWNIAPNRDATFTPTVISKRGAGLGTEFRYLQPTFEGKATLNVLPDDQLAHRSRGAFALKHEGLFLGDGYYKADLTRVTDDDYWKDFPRELKVLTPRLLPGDAQASKHFGDGERSDWETYTRVQRWQVLQTTPLLSPSDAILPAPYDRLPQIGVRGRQELDGGFEMLLETEANRFTNPDGNLDPLRLTGSRAHVLGALSWPHVTPGWSLVPKVSINAATYALDQPMPAGSLAGRTSFGRSTPSFSLDSAWVLERDTEIRGRSMRQTLEPRLLYVRTPYRRAQNDLPNFDSASKDFNFDSIYTDNAFSGVDRVSDANQLTAGVTTRIVDAQTGAEAVRLGVAQRFLFDEQHAFDGTPITQRVSDFLLLGSAMLFPKWTLDASWQYSPELHRTVRSVAGVRYSPSPYRTLNIAYRLARAESEQIDVGWQWPIYGTPRNGRRTASSNSCSGAWYSVGRINYSLRDSRVTDSVLGFEYDSGCWIGRVVAKRLSTSQVEATTQIGLEIEFVGLSHLGTNALGVLKENVPGYQLLRDNATKSSTSVNSP